MQADPTRSFSEPPEPLARIAGFGPGARLLTPAGEVPARHLTPGDLVVTRDGPALPVLWRGTRRLSRVRLLQAPGLRPVEFGPGTFGDGGPARPTLLAPATRVLLTGWRVALHSGPNEALADAAHLVGGASSGAGPVDADGVVYTYLLLPAHSVVRANGLWVETLLLDRAVRGEFRDEFPPGLLSRAQVIAGHARAARLCLADWEVAAIRGLPVRRPDDLSARVA